MKVIKNESLNKLIYLSGAIAYVLSSGSRYQDFSVCCKMAKCMSRLSNKENNHQDWNFTNMNTEMKKKTKLLEER